MVLVGLFKVAPWMATISALGLIVAAVYSLIMMQRAFQGKPKEGLQLPDYGVREMLTMAVMIIGLVWLGLYPQPVLDTAQPVLDSLTTLVGSGESSVVEASVVEMSTAEVADNLNSVQIVGVVK